MGKVKITLSIDEEMLKKAKSKAAVDNKTLSQLVEEAFTNIDTISILEGIASMLGSSLKIISYDEVMKDRTKGVDSAKVVREVRDERREVLP